MPPRALLLCLLLAACGPAAAPTAKAPAAPATPAFDDQNDAALVKAATAAVSVHPAARGAYRFRDILISDTPDKAQRSVCGQTSTDGERWKGFVHVIRRGEAQQWITVQQDTMSPQVEAACKPAVMKYLGEANVDFAEADAAFTKAGCKETMDVEYWDAFKRYCHGQVTRPAGAGS